MPLNNLWNNFGKILDSFQLTYTEEELDKRHQKFLDEMKELEDFLAEDTNINKYFEEANRYFVEAMEQWEYMNGQLPKDLKEYEEIKKMMQDIRGNDKSNIGKKRQNKLLEQYEKIMNNNFMYGK